MSRIIRPIGGLRPSRGYQSNRLVEAITNRMGGIAVSRETAEPAGDLYIQHGYRLTPGLQNAMQRRIPFVILDQGYFDPRIDKFSISINGLHGLSMQVDEVYSLPARPKPAIQPWREPGGPVVYVFGQLPGDRALRGCNMETWPTRTAQEASEAFMRPALIRPHPKMLASWEKPLPSLQSVWEECHVAVTWTSTVAVQAAIAGVPVVALHPANPAYNVAAHDFARLRMPGRNLWLHDLSYRQYSFNELDKAIEYIELAYPKAAGLAAAGDYDTAGLRV